MLFCKAPSPVEVYNDLDDDLINFFSVLRDPKMFPDFYNRAWLTPYSRREFEFCRDNLNSDPNPVERARRFFCLARFSYGGQLCSFAFNVSSSKNGMTQRVAACRSVLCMLPMISERLSTIEIENNDFRKILKTYDRPETLFFLDPPYLHETRKSDKYYRHEMTREDHEELIGILKNIQGKAILSGYPSELYESLGWKKESWEVNCNIIDGMKIDEHTTKERRKRTECVWLNF